MSDWYRKLRESYGTFVRATHSPADHQAALLRDLIAYVGDSAFARDHHFDRVSSVADYRKAVPIRTIEELGPYLQRAFDGEPSVLFPGTPVFFAQTSGTTGKPKYIPFSDHDAVSRAQISHWLGRHTEEELTTMVVILGSYHEDTSPGGVPIGSASGFLRRALSDVPVFSAIPHQVLELTEPTARYYGILRGLLAMPLRAMGAINPSTVLALLEHIRELADALIGDIRDGGHRRGPAGAIEALSAAGMRFPADPRRAAHIETVLRRADDSIGDCFADLQDLYTWKDGSLGLYLPQLQRAFPRVRLRRLPAGSSEGVNLVPTVSDIDECTIAPGTSFFEYLPADRAPVAESLVELPELVVGGEYRFVVSNYRGMYRLLGDDVFVMIGWDGAMPLFRFLNRTMLTSSVTGEKLTGNHVEAAVLGALPRLPVSARDVQLALDWREGARPRYAVVIDIGRSTADDDSLRAFLHEIERRLCEQNSEYAAKRSSARLDPPVIIVVGRDYFARLRFKATVERRRSDAQYKLPSLASAPLNRDELPVVKQLEF